MARIFFNYNVYGSASTHAKVVNSVDELHAACEELRNDPCVQGIDVEFLQKTVTVKEMAL